MTRAASKAGARRYGSRISPRSHAVRASTTISRQLLGDLDAAFRGPARAPGYSSSELWEEERGQLLPVPAHELRGAQAHPGRDQLARNGQDRGAGTRCRRAGRA